MHFKDALNPSTGGDPNYISAMYNLGLTYFAEKKYKDAVTEFAQLSPKQLNFPLFLEKWGEACYFNADRECAITNLNDNIVAQRHDDESHLLLALIYFTVDNDEKHAMKELANINCNPPPPNVAQTKNYTKNYLDSLLYVTCGISYYFQTKFNDADLQLVVGRRLYPAFEELIWYYHASIAKQKGGDEKQVCQFWSNSYQAEIKPLGSDIRGADIKAHIDDCKKLGVDFSN